MCCRPGSLTGFSAPILTLPTIRRCVSGGAWKALRRHDWPAEGEFWQQLSEDEDECCAPGIGFVLERGCVLHFCPSGFGGGPAYFINGDQCHELAYVGAGQQRRLLRLLYGGRRESSRSSLQIT